MSADVDKMFSVREMPWWIGTKEDKGQATILNEHPSWEEARVLAGLDWDPTEEPLYRRRADADQLRKTFAGVLMDATISEADKIEAMLAAYDASLSQVEGWKHIGRSDDAGATLACTMDSYSVVHNSAFGQIFEAVLDQTNVKFETGGSLAEGRKVWMLCKLDEPIELPGDNSVTMPYLALMSRHDAKGSTVLRATAVRIVCANTFRAAEMASGDSYDVRRAGATYSFVHRGDVSSDSESWQSRLSDAREAVTGARREMREYAEMASRLLGIPVSAKQSEKFIHMFIPSPPEGIITDRVARNIEEARNAVRGILKGQTVEGSGCGGTAYGLVQAAVEYLDHVRMARTWESRLNRTLIQAEPLKAKAMRLALEAARS